VELSVHPDQKVQEVHPVRKDQPVLLDPPEQREQLEPVAIKERMVLKVQLGKVV